MKRNNTLTLMMILIISGFTITSNAQFGKIGKDLKKKAKKTIVKVENKTGNDEYSEDCLRHKKDLDYNTGKIEEYLNNNDLRSAKNYIKYFQRYINRYKEDNCPFLSKWEQKYEELKNQYTLKLAQSNPVAYLIVAAENGEKEQVDLALKQGADINKFEENTCALFTAVKNEKIEMVKYLVEKGADVNNKATVYKTVNTALYYSVKKNNLEITKYLLNKGADPTISTENIVVIAAKNNNLEMIKVFDQHPKIDICAAESTAYEIITALSVAQEGSDLAKYLKTRVLETKKAKITDATNKKFANRMVFSSEKIPATGANESKFSTTFQASKNIYGRLYIESLYSEYYYGTESKTPDYNRNDISVYAKIAGDSKMFNIDGIDASNDNDASTYEIVLNTGKYRSTYHKFFMRLKQGNNKVKLYAVASKDTLLAETVTFTKKAGDSFKIGKSFADFKAGMKNPALEASVLKAIQTYAANSGWKEKFKAVKISSSDWNIIRHKVSGRILKRTLSAYCYAQWPDGYCTVQSFTFSQEYNGTSYSKTFKRYSNGSQTIIDCK